MHQEFIVRIKPGAYIGQDHFFSYWPNCHPPIRDFATDGSNPYCAKDPDMLFLAKRRCIHSHTEFPKNEKFVYWSCVADGYGVGGDKETEY